MLQILQSLHTINFCQQRYHAITLPSFLLSYQKAMTHKCLVFAWCRPSVFLCWLNLLLIMSGSVKLTKMTGLKIKLHIGNKCQFCKMRWYQYSLLYELDVYEMLFYQLFIYIDLNIKWNYNCHNLQIFCLCRTFQKYL